MIMNIALLIDVTSMTLNVFRFYDYYFQLLCKSNAIGMIPPFAEIVKNPATFVLLFFFSLQLSVMIQNSII